MGVLLVIVGFFYSWNGFKLKSKPFFDLLSHAIFLGAMQFLIIYLAFRSLDLLVVPFLMIIMPFSAMEEIMQELRDFEIDKKTNIENTVQSLEKFNLKKVLLGLGLFVLIGFSFVLYYFIMQNNFINLLMTSSVAVIAFFRLYSQMHKQDVISNLEVKLKIFDL
jgi:4-hydroxybenzoate polyprenyltransferase